MNRSEFLKRAAGVAVAVAVGRRLELPAPVEADANPLPILDNFERAEASYWSSWTPALHPREATGVLIASADFKGVTLKAGDSLGMRWTTVVGDEPERWHRPDGGFWRRLG